MIQNIWYKGHKYFLFFFFQVISLKIMIKPKYIKFDVGFNTDFLKYVSTL